MNSDIWPQEESASHHVSSYNLWLRPFDVCDSQVILSHEQIKKNVRHHSIVVYPVLPRVPLKTESLKQQKMKPEESASHHLIPGILGALLLQEERVCEALSSRGT